jgi:hypothetical protein
VFSDEKSKLQIKQQGAVVVHGLECWFRNGKRQFLAYFVILYLCDGAMQHRINGDKAVSPSKYVPQNIVDAVFHWCSELAPAGATSNQRQSELKGSASCVKVKP